MWQGSTVPWILLVRELFFICEGDPSQPQGQFQEEFPWGWREKTAFRHPEHRHHPVQSVETKLFQTGHSLVWVRKLEIKTTQPHQTQPFPFYISVLSCVIWRGWPTTSLLSCSAQTVHVDYIYLPTYKFNHSGVIGVKFGEFLMCPRTNHL